LKGGHPNRAGDLIGYAVQHRLGAFETVQQLLDFGNERLRGGGEFEPAPRFAQQRHPGLSFEQRQLLRNPRRREIQRGGNRGDRAAIVQLPQQAQALHIEHLGPLSIAGAVLLRVLCCRRCGPGGAASQYFSKTEPY